MEEGVANVSKITGTCNVPSLVQRVTYLFNYYMIFITYKNLGIERLF